MSRDEGRQKMVGTNARAMLLRRRVVVMPRTKVMLGDRNRASHGTEAWSLWGPEPGSGGKCYITVQNHGIYHKSLSVYLGGKCHGNPFPACHVTVGSPDGHAGSVT